MQNSPYKPSEEVILNLEKKQYGVFNHSAVQICTWTKKSLTGKGECYKNKFYGVKTHSCMEFSPSAMVCSQRCTFCWRPTEYMKNFILDVEKVDEPEMIVKNLLEKRKKLLTGFKGNKEVILEKLDESYSQDPVHYAISLSGEPTLYPKLNELVKYLKSLPRTETIFIVTNAQEPEFFINLDSESLPTQLYISLDAPNEELYKKINCPLYSDGWERLNKSLFLASNLPTRKVIRFTQIKGLNDKDKFLKDYSRLFELYKADFIEVKAYMHIGLSQKRHSKEQMPEFEEVKEFALKLCKENPNYELVDEMKDSRIVLLKRKDSLYGCRIY